VSLNAKEIKLKALTFKKLFLKRYKRFPSLLQDADDFEQFCLETMWRRQSIHLRFLWVATDFIESRQCQAVQGFRDKQSVEGSNLIVEPSNVFNQAFRYDGVLDFFQKSTLEDLHKIKLDMIDRSLVLLVLKWGFNFKEVSDLYGMDQSAISHRLKKIKGAVRNLRLS
jgi:hypothetical protein